jgi:hypothetical protein
MRVLGGRAASGQLCCCSLLSPMARPLVELSVGLPSHPLDHDSYFLQVGTLPVEPQGQAHFGNPLCPMFGWTNTGVNGSVMNE